MTGKARAVCLGAVLAAGVALGNVAAQTLEPTPPADFAQGAESLQPGQYAWSPSVAPGGSMTIYVDLSRQLAAVYRGGTRIGITTISSGREGHETPTGVFHIMSKDAHHHSNRYDNAPMPFSQRLTDDGVALHAGRVPGYPESHGCVHLPYGFAKALFSETRIGATVVMMEDQPNGLDASSPQTASAETAGLSEDTVATSTSNDSADRPITAISSKSN